MSCIFALNYVYKVIHDRVPFNRAFFIEVSACLHQALLHVLAVCSFNYVLLELSQFIDELLFRLLTQPN